MRSRPTAVTLSALLLAAAAAWAAPQNDSATPAKPAKPAEKKEMAAPGATADFLRELDEAQDKLLALAEAMPAEKYSWRPGEGVRSVGEVFAHVAVPNFFVPKAWGAHEADLAGIDARNLEKAGNDKAKMIDALKRSFAYAHGEVGKLSAADLDKPIDLFGGKSTARGGVLLLITHAHEHLGQAIAYARMNGVVPPWSAKQGG